MIGWVFEDVEKPAFQDVRLHLGGSEGMEDRQVLESSKAIVYEWNPATIPGHETPQWPVTKAPVKRTVHEGQGL